MDRYELGPPTLLDSARNQWTVEVLRDGKTSVDTIVVDPAILPPRKGTGKRASKVLWRMPESGASGFSLGYAEKQIVLGLFDVRRKARKAEARKLVARCVTALPPLRIRSALRPPPAPTAPTPATTPPTHPTSPQQARAQGQGGRARGRRQQRRRGRRGGG